MAPGQLQPVRRSTSLKALFFSLVVCCVSCHEQAPLPGGAKAPPVQLQYQKWTDPQLDTLADLSVEALRERIYGSVVRLEKRMGAASDDSAYNRRFSEDGSPAYDTFMASYDSDGLRVYTRVDIPAAPPSAKGYPVMIFVHGWEGIDAAPDFDFGYKADSLYSRYVDAFVDAGYVVLMPGLRGHGTLDGIPADGIEFLQAWDNGSYLSPVFYAIDVLNLLDSLQTLHEVDWGKWGYPQREPLKLDTATIHLNGHSQGGDAALMAMAVSGEGSPVRNPITTGSIWSGCFGARFDQVHIYGPMATTLEAFMSGDGTWTGSAVGHDGSVNPNFVFAWPSDWIGTLDTQSPEWTWQAETWGLGGVAEALQAKFSEMYSAVNTQVADIDDASFEVITAASGNAEVRHDPRIRDAMREIGAYYREQYLTEPLLLHHSDQDYYSPPSWNADLSARINAAGGHAVDHTYTGNTHSLLVSEHGWFSKPGTVAGFDLMIEHDLEMQAGH
jgi:dienelactone hydrolase